MKKFGKITAVILAAALSQALALPASAELVYDEKTESFYYVKEDGVRPSGLYYTPYNKGRPDEFYKMINYDDSGYIIGAYNGFTKNKAGRRYYHNGYRLFGWQNIDGKYYHFNRDGFADTGKCEIAGVIYYLGKDGAWNGKISEYTYPEDFSLEFISGYGKDDSFSTKDNSVKKLVGTDHEKNENIYSTAEHIFSENDLQIMWSAICEYSLTDAKSGVYDVSYLEKVLSEEDEIMEGPEPNMNHIISFTADGKKYSFDTFEELDYIKYTDSAAWGLCNMRVFLDRLLHDTEEFKSFPESEVEYW